MISAFTLIKVTSQRKVQVFKKIKKLPMLKDITLVYGEYDLIIRTSTKNIEELNRFIYNVLRKIPQITMTTTMIVAKIPKQT
jgi:DNA-binding Lrp family transcriptional regulator